MTASLRTGVLVSSALLALLASAASRADGPLRGNPVDALPRVQTPANTGAPRPQPALQAPTPEQQAVQARLAQRIVPRNFDVSGVRTLPFDEVSAILTPLAGKETTVGALVAEVNKITALYRDRGYPLSFALLQNQSFANGLVAVTVVEGYISNVQIDGDIGNARDRLESLAAPLLEEKPLTQPTLERVLNLMRTVPGVRFQPKLDLPRRADGATELVLAATRRPVTADGGIADLGTGMQPLVNVAGNSLTPLGEQVKLTSSIPLNSDDVRYVAARITVPLGADGLALHVDAHHYQSWPQDDAVERLGYDREVTNNRVGVGLSYPLLLNNRRSLVATAGVYAVNAKDRYEARNSDRWLQQDVDVRAATAELRYRDVLPSRSTEVGLGVSQGFNAAGADKTVDTNYGYTGVPDVSLNFTRYNLDVKQTFTLPAQFGLVLNAAGQYTDDILPSSEQVSYGSWRYGMGYPQGEKSGDKGVGVSAEINRRFGIGWKYLTSVQPYAMVDYARTWYNNRTVQNNNPGHLSSVGLGMRFTDDKYYLFDVNVAKPVGSRTVDDGDRDLRFNANYSLFYDAF
ncbi:ShlB/FhaC/HecB family hemolysin secretion/activation protein [Bordetella petrii]|uniref:ShlB/FhaC/HecB family hemolysin secretion/activation protein n=1 Tax=Bordetella petrii TaxID=94624 RepID=UPI001A961612|nr:ShlB/FhaC/HecB family hemolysin secretion/activation protein [Bordetella petrii]MBO1112378.1 ShlB/FhaC/HecB family hemolysin secretion/activation protein [Bordetella petrii]